MEAPWQMYSRRCGVLPSHVCDMDSCPLGSGNVSRGPNDCISEHDHDVLHVCLFTVCSLVPLQKNCSVCMR